MKTVPVGLASHLTGEVTTLAWAWQITRTDGVILRFTAHDNDLTIGGETYLCATGFSADSIQTGSRLAADTSNVTSLLGMSGINGQDLRNGCFDYAEVLLMIVNWADPTTGLIKLRRGWLGEATLTPTGTFKSELRGMTQVFSQSVGQLYSPECRADLGDARCGLNMTLGAGWTVPFTVASVIDRFTVTVTLTEPRAVDGWFADGLLRWLTGPNAGRAIEVRTWVRSTNTVTLYLPCGFVPVIGDTGQIQPGCDKRLNTCGAGKFNNVINFRGEPFLPGMDKLLLYPDAKQG